MEITENELLNELDQWLSVPEVMPRFDPAKHVTYDMFTAKYGCTYMKARKALEELIHKGILRKLKVLMEDGHWCIAYERVGD